MVTDLRNEDERPWPVLAFELRNFIKAYRKLRGKFFPNCFDTLSPKTFYCYLLGVSGKLPAGQIKGNQSCTDLFPCSRKIRVSYA
jgi:hypothetical protein